MRRSPFDSGAPGDGPPPAAPAPHRSDDGELFHMDPARPEARPDPGRFAGRLRNLALSGDPRIGVLAMAGAIAAAILAGRNLRPNESATQAVILFSVGV